MRLTFSQLAAAAARRQDARSPGRASDRYHPARRPEDAREAPADLTAQLAVEGRVSPHEEDHA